MAVDIRNRNFPVERFSPLLRSKACEARPVDETASKVWSRGQNIQGVCRRIFWEPQEFAFAGANCRGVGISLAALPPFLCANKEMGVNIINDNPSVFCLRQNTAPFTQGSLSILQHVALQMTFSTIPYINIITL